MTRFTLGNKLYKLITITLMFAILSAIALTPGCTRRQTGSDPASGINGPASVSGEGSDVEAPDATETSLETGYPGGAANGNADGSGDESGNGSENDSIAGIGNGIGDGLENGNNGGGENGNSESGEGGGVTPGGLADIYMPDIPYDSEAGISGASGLAGTTGLAGMTELAGGFILKVNPCNPNAMVNSTRDIPFLVSAVDMISISTYSMSSSYNSGYHYTLALEPSSAPRVSYDKSKIAYITPYSWESIGKLYIFDTEINQDVALTGASEPPQIIEPTFDGIDARQYKPNSITWLDNRHLLVVMQYIYGTVTLGGNVYVYDTDTQTTKMVILAPEPTMGVPHVAVKDGVATVYVGEYIDGSTYNEFISYTIEIPVNDLYDLIEWGEVMELVPRGANSAD
jgi:hypothetical protein